MARRQRQMCIRDSQQPVDLEALKNENETENSAQDTQSTESNPLEASDITNENLNEENE